MPASRQSAPSRICQCCQRVRQTVKHTIDSYIKAGLLSLHDTDDDGPMPSDCSIREMKANFIPKGSEPKTSIFFGGVFVQNLVALSQTV